MNNIEACLLAETLANEMVFDEPNIDQLTQWRDWARELDAYLSAEMGCVLVLSQEAA